MNYRISNGFQRFMLPQEKLTVFIVLAELSFSINRLSIGPFIADLEIKIMPYRAAWLRLGHGLQD